MAGQNPWVNPNYYGNAAPYAFSYNPSNSSEAYNLKYGNNYYNDNYQAPSYASPARRNPTSVSRAYSQGGYSQRSYANGNGYPSNNGNRNNYAPSVSEYSVQDEPVVGAGAGAVAGRTTRGEAGSLGSGSRWSMGSIPKEKQGQDVITMMDNGQFALNEAKVARNIKEYRKDYREGMWTRGSRPKIFGRFICFFLMVVIYLIIGGILSLALYIRPPSASFTKPGGSGGDSGALSGVQFDGQVLSIPLQMNFSIWNPNFIKASVKIVHVDLFYELNGSDRPLGNGTVNDVWIRSKDRTNFTLPIDVRYDLKTDPNLEILSDIVNKCQSQGLDFKANAMVAANILGIGVSSPIVPINVNVGCPIPDNVFDSIQKVQGLLGNIFGVNVGGGS
ncbi:hypothetical protein K435DRAFT_775883 [Dendrothele bispora CBS 962.96]|uniref:Late embryogenesis abundant protein LEA-2 subgroup domain-containing protein n=1 Tax=Dendrothele bispora (strain CBS 962.96) TaxID=1314807 RepID=A0A4S8MGW2_DENBC|nr:hypothetical protein K435DRAFT_775883 [Dendrothele bispora CBS 962.96]